MAEVVQVDAAGLEKLSVEFRIEANDMAEHATRFANRCGSIGDAYGNLPQSQDAVRMYLSAVGSMGERIDQRVAELHAHADALAAAAARYRAAQEAAVQTAAGWAAETGLPRRGF